MKLIKRLIILVIAAMLGAALYGKIKAVDNVAGGSKTSYNSSTSRTNSSFKGGLGPVGNPYAPKQPQKKTY